MKKITRFLAMLLVAISVLMIVPQNDVSAKQSKEPNPKLNVTFKDMVVGETFKLKIKEAPEGKTVTYTSSDKKVAKVSSKGKITAKKAGETIITVECDGKSYSCGIVVLKKDTFSEWRKQAKGVKDNYSLIAIVQDTYILNEAYNSENEYYYNGDYGNTHGTIDLLQTRENLLATGLFEEVKNSKMGTVKNGIMEMAFDEGKYPFGVKPIKPFTSNGKTYPYIAECDGYYVSCYTGAVYTEFFKNGYETQYDRTLYFRNKKAKIYTTLYDANGKVMSSDSTYEIPITTFISGTITRKAGTKYKETIYCGEGGLGINRKAELFDGNYLHKQHDNGAVEPVRFLVESFWTSLPVSRGDNNLYISGADEYLFRSYPYYYGLYYYIK